VRMTMRRMFKSARPDHRTSTQKSKNKTSRRWMPMDADKIFDTNVLRS
jgi:hypothetical protein